MAGLLQGPAGASDVEKSFEEGKYAELKLNAKVPALTKTRCAIMPCEGIVV